MKFNRSIHALCLALSASYALEAKAGRFIVDKIVTRVNGANILKSALEAPQIDKDGGKDTLDDAINRKVLVQEADKKKLTATPADVERSLVSFKMQNNLTDLSDADFEQELRGMGFTLDRYKRQLADLLTIRNLQSNEAMSQRVVSADEIEQYYHAHPVYSKEKFHIAIADLSREQAKDISKLDPTKDVAWRDLGWFETRDINELYRDTVTKLPAGKISKKVIKSGDKNQLVWLKEKRERALKSLERRYAKIEQELQREKMEPLMDNLVAQARKKAHIVYP